VDAQLAADVAQVAFEAAERSWVDLDGLISSEKARLRHLEGGDRSTRELEESAHVARADFDEAKKRLSACRARYQEFAARDSYVHSQVLYEADVAQQEAARNERRTARRGALTRLRGRG